MSRPFPRPAGGRIAVKVVNHYGDEVMKVYASAEAVASPAFGREAPDLGAPVLRVTEEPD